MVVLNIQDSDLVRKDNEESILNKINLKVNSGDIVLLSGINGAGKSSLLKSLLAYSVCEELEYANFKNGTLKLCGAEFSDDVSQQIIYIDQKDEPGKEYRYSEKVIMDGIPESIKKKKKFLADWLEKYNVLTDDDISGVFNSTVKKKDKPLLKKRFSTLSGGQRKWICILQGLIKTELPDYKIALIDEPLNNLDAKHIKLFNNLLLSILSNNPNFCFLIVSHCHAFTKISRLYEIEKNTIVKKNYQTHNCFGPYNDEGFYENLNYVNDNKDENK